MNSTENLIRKIFSDNLQLNIDKITSDNDLLKSGIDSITFVKLIVALETEFQIEFDDDFLNVETLSTINKLTQYIDNKTK